jgi:hypothetical protein
VSRPELFFASSRGCGRSWRIRPLGAFDGTARAYQQSLVTIPLSILAAIYVIM